MNFDVDFDDKDSLYSYLLKMCAIYRSECVTALHCRHNYIMTISVAVLAVVERVKAS